MKLRNWKLRKYHWFANVSMTRDRMMSVRMNRHYNWIGGKKLFIAHLSAHKKLEVNIAQQTI